MTYIKKTKDQHKCVILPTANTANTANTAKTACSLTRAVLNTLINHTHKKDAQDIEWTATDIYLNKVKINLYSFPELTVPLVSHKIDFTTSPPPPQTTPALSTLMKKCSAELWDEEVVRNSTLVGGINAGTFRDHGQVDSIGECMEYCCSESDCDLSFMIDQDCYTVKCYSESLCLTRTAKPTAFTTLIAFKKAYKIGTHLFFCYRAKFA